MLEYLALLLPVAAGSGWYLGRRGHSTGPHDQLRPIPREYFVGLNFLINEQPDKAVDIFIKMLEVDSSTVEMHWALGSLFRQRGEVDRASRIHQNLIARPGLTREERTISLIELGQDYMRAGVFDRAERLFQEAIDKGPNEHSYRARKFLLAIYEQEKEWNRAIDTAKRLQSATGESKAKRIAHYYCELAEQARSRGDVDQAKRQLKKALTADRQCVRAMLCRAALEVDAGQYKTAIRYYKRIREQDPDYLPETVEPLADCCKRLGKDKELIEYLHNCLKNYPRVSIALVLSDKIRQWQGRDMAIAFITEQIERNPSLSGLNKIIDLHMQLDNDEAVKATQNPSGPEPLIALKTVTDKLLNNRHAYQCTLCGFTGKSMHWLCPECRRWGTVKPIRE